MTKNVDDCFMRKFEGLDGDVDAMNRCHYERCQNLRRRRRQEKKEDVVKLIETVAEEYFKDPKTENVEHETSKIQRPKNMEKIRRVDISHATFALL